MAVFTNDAIFLGNFADADTSEGTGSLQLEDTSIYAQTFGSSGSPLYNQIVDMAFDDANNDGLLYVDNFAGAENISYDLGAGPVTTRVDSVQRVDLTVTYVDGTTQALTDVVLFQDQLGNMFLQNSNGDSGSLNGPSGLLIQSVNVTNVQNLNYAGIDQFSNLEDIAGPVDGTSGNDNIDGAFVDVGGDQAGSNSDVLYGYGGNDTLVSGLGNDSLFGGDGDDFLRPGHGNDSVYGESGNDTLELSDNDFLDGGADTDALDATWGNFGETVTFNADNSGLTDNGSTFQNIEIFVSDGGSDNYDASAATGPLSIFTGLDDDTILGGQGADSLVSGSGNDSVVGGAGNDTIDAGAGNDSLFGGAGDDSIDGGAGDDFFDASRGRDGADTLIGGAGNDTIQHGLLDAVVEGGDGNDYIVNIDMTSSANITTINGGAGTDTYALDTSEGAGFTSGQVVDLSIGYVTFNGGLRDVLSGFENIDLVNTASGAIGDAGDNVITASGTFDNVLEGGAGNDSIDAGGGNDRLIGGTGDDTLLGGVGDDTVVIENGMGNDSLIGGDDTDLIDMSAVSSGITATFTANGTGTFDNGADTVSFSGFESFQFTDQSDVITAGSFSLAGTFDLGGGDDAYSGGGSAAETVFAGTGNDTVTARGNNSSVSGGDGNDVISVQFGNTSTLDGGAGDDALTMEFGSSGTLLGGDGNDTLAGRDAADLLDGGTGNDSLVGGGGADTLIGGDGQNRLDGGDGNDSLVGNATDANSFTSMVGGAGADTIDGTVGFWDIASYHSSADGVNIDLSDGLTESGGDALGDTLIGIEQIDGSNTGNDTIRAGSGTIELKGFGGNDSLVGSTDNNSIGGGDGDDSISGGAGADTLEGDAGNDSIAGGTGNDQVFGGQGNDTIVLGDNYGGDFIDGGEDTAVGDIDWIDASAVTLGAMTISISGGDDGQITSSQGTSNFLNIEGFTLTDQADNFAGANATSDLAVDGGGGADTIIGGAGNDLLSGGAGNDRFDLTNGFGTDTIIGGDEGSDFDILTAGSTTAAVTVVYSGNEAGSITQEADSVDFSQIEQVYLTGYSDYVDATSTTTGVYLIAGNGNDTIIGGTGADSLFGSNGQNQLFGGAGNDSITGGLSGDTIEGGDGDDFIDGGRGNDLLRTGAGRDTLLGGDGDDTLLNSVGDDSLVGGAGDDSIVATWGADTLEGGTGNDTLIGGADNDSIEGGAGDDLIFSGTRNIPGEYTEQTGTSDSFTGTNGNGDFTGTTTSNEGSVDTFSNASISGYWVGNGDGVETHTHTFSQVVAGARIDFNAINFGEYLTFIIDGVAVDLPALIANGDAVFDGANAYGIDGSGRIIETGPETNATVGSVTFLRPFTTIDVVATADIPATGIVYEMHVDTNPPTASDDDFLSGGDDADTFIIENAFGNDTIVGGEGGNDNDVIDLSGLSGPVTITYDSTGAESGTITDGIDTITFSEIERVILTDQADSVDGSATQTGEFGDAPGINVDGRGGNDTILGGRGGDTIEGGTGEDWIVGDYGDDSLSGGDGDDTIFGDDFIDTENGNDTIDGGAGNDFIDGGNQDDTLIGGSGNDSVFGRSGNDSIEGGTGDDSLEGGDGNDSISGGTGNDTLRGGNGTDTVNGGDGNDVLGGWNGNDSLDGGTGNDSLTGGDGNDTFTYNVGDGLDTIADFNFGNTGALGDNDSTNNDFIDFSNFYDDIGELRRDFDDDGILNQSNSTANGGDVDYSNNDQFASGEGVEFENSSRESFTTDNTGVVCFAAGTLILTDKGEVPVERLRAGDLIATYDNGLQPLAMLASRRLNADTLSCKPELKPIEIKPGALGAERRLVVSPQHMMLVQHDGDEALVRARQLSRLQGGGVRVMHGCRQVTYFHLIFEAHQIVFANNRPAESFYPGSRALSALSQPARDEFNLLFPDLAPLFGTEVAPVGWKYARDAIRTRFLPKGVEHLNSPTLYSLNCK